MAEDPPFNSGVRFAARPGSGGTVDIQVFLPEAAGALAYGFVLEFEDSARRFDDFFDIVSASAWVQVVLQSPGGGTPQVIRRQLDLSETGPGKGSGRSVLFFAPPRIPPGGLIGALTLRAKQDIPSDLPLLLTATVTVLSRSPPERMLKYRTTRVIPWS